MCIEIVGAQLRDHQAIEDRGLGVGEHPRKPSAVQASVATRQGYGSSPEEKYSYRHAAQYLSPGWLGVAMIPALKSISGQLFRVPNKPTQVMFDPLPTVVAAKVGVASSAPELRS